MSKYELIEYDLSNDVAIIRLNDPASLNGISPAMAYEIIAAIDQAAEKARALIIAGNGKGFCSGANVGGDSGLDLQDPERDLGVGLDEYFNPMILRLRHLPIPYICAVHGAVAGIGCSLALMADFIVAAKNAYFLQAFCKLGLVPDGGSPYLLARTIGRVRAMELMLLGEKYPAAQALQDGLINRVVENEDLESTAMSIATKLASGPTATLLMIRDSAWAALESTLDEQLERERMLQKEAGRTDDFLEGLAAFQEKRPAKFTGR